jgi:hypothetical protein
MVMTNYTAADIRKVIEANVEDASVPTMVLKALVKNEGKKLTKRIYRDLDGGEESWNLTTEYGSTKLVERQYYRTGGREGYCFYFGYNFDGIIDCEKFMASNPCYYAGRIDRNSKREALLLDNARLESIAWRLNKALAAQEEYKKATDCLSEALEGVPDMSYVRCLLPELEA